MGLRRDVRADVLAGVGVAVISVLLAAPVGLLWAAVSPQADVQIVNAQRIGYVDPEPRAFLGADLTFLLIGLVVGAGLGIIAWVVARRHAPAVVVGLVVGGVLAALIASKVGARVGRADFVESVRAGRPGVVRQSVSLVAKQCLVGWPIGALAAFLTLTLVREREAPAASAQVIADSVWATSSS